MSVQTFAASMSNTRAYDLGGCSPRSLLVGNHGVHISPSGVLGGHPILGG